MHAAPTGATAVWVFAVLLLILTPGSSFALESAQNRASAAPAVFYCPAAELIYAAGSGGDQGPNLALRNEIENGIGTDKRTFWSRALFYPAVSIGGWDGVNGLRAALSAGSSGAYRSSVDKGKRELRRLIGELIRNCGSKTRIILSGYSQGAQVVADVYQEMERAGRADKIYAVVLFGDPRFNGGKHGCGSSTGELRHRDGVNGSLKKRPGYSSKCRNRVRSYCHRRDPICQANRPANPTPEWFLNTAARLFVNRGHHKNYHSKGEAHDAGRWLSTRLRTDLAPPKPPSPPPPPSANCSPVATTETHTFYGTVGTPISPVGLVDPNPIGNGADKFGALTIGDFAPWWPFEVDIGSPVAPGIALDPGYSGAGIWVMRGTPIRAGTFCSVVYWGYGTTLHAQKIIWVLTA